MEAKRGDAGAEGPVRRGRRSAPKLGSVTRAIGAPTEDCGNRDGRHKKDRLDPVIGSPVKHIRR